jgi:hypothetical protein
MEEVLSISIQVSTPLHSPYLRGRPGTCLTFFETDFAKRVSDFLTPLQIFILMSYFTHHHRSNIEIFNHFLLGGSFQRRFMGAKSRADFFLPNWSRFIREGAARSSILHNSTSG